jgi:hypothetical protein
MAKARTKAVTKLPPGYECLAAPFEVPSLPDGALYTRMGEDMLIVGYESAQDMRTGYDRWLHAAHEIKRLQALVDTLREGISFAHQTLDAKGDWEEAQAITYYGWQEIEPGREGEIDAIHRRERSLLSHLRHHKAKEWLRRGAKREEAETILNAIDKTSSNRINLALARLLSRTNPRAVSKNLGGRPRKRKSRPRSKK